MPRLKKFYENALKASSSRTWTLEGKESVEEEGSIDEEAPERRGFRVVMDLRLSVIDMTNANRNRGRKRKDNQKSPKQHQ